MRVKPNIYAALQRLRIMCAAVMIRESGYRLIFNGHLVQLSK